MTASVESGFAVSPRQRHLWCRSGRAFNQARVVLDGSVQRQRLRDAVRGTVAVHEALRTNFVERPGTSVPVQVIAATSDVDLDVVQLPARRATLDELCVAEQSRVDITEGPGFRATLALSDGARPVLVLTAHPSVADGQSLRLVVLAIAAAYGGGRSHGATDVMQPADFAAWHDDLLTTAESAPLRAAWSDLLGTAEARLVLGDGAVGGTWRSGRLELGGDLVAGLDAVCQAHDVTPAEVLTTAFQVTLWRYAWERAVIGLVAVSGRGFDVLHGAVGSYERELPVVCDFEADQPFADAVRVSAARLRELTERIDHLDPNAVPGSAVLFHCAEATTPALADGVVFDVAAEQTAGVLGMRVTCVPRGDRLVVDFGHDDAYADPEVAVAFVETFGELVRAVMADPSTPVGDAGVHSAAGRAAIVVEGAGPATEPPGTAVHELFEAQVTRSPERIAVTGDDVELTYAELDARANALARHLVELGVGRGDRVVVSVGRSPELVVALLGVLKVGAAFVPVDIGYPVARLRYVLSDAAPLAIVTVADVRDRLGDTDVPCVLLDDDQAGGTSAPTAPLGVHVDPADTAYVMYTSGTTGTPNGVVVPHRGLANYLTWCAAEYDLAGGDGVLVHTSISFDLTLTGLLGPLLVGQRVLLLSETAGVIGLVAALRTSRDLTLVKLTPTHLAVLGQLLRADEVAGSVRTLVVGGEALRAEQVELFRGAGTRVVNEYGPTETVVGSTAYRLAADTPATGPVPIGTPVANTTIHLLDPRGCLVPAGATGEICVAGTGVTDGYLNRPELTERRFVPDPFGAAGTTMYRTGDLGRRRGDGVLDYLGRADQQIKIRGVRIEPAEVETVLLGHPGVSQAVVVARSGDGPTGTSPLVSDLTLVAYVVPAQQAPTVAELVEHCRSHLPEQSVPAAVVLLETLPFNANGKLDRAALPRPAGPNRSAGDYVPPATETEEILAGTIATVLNVDRVGVLDNYFVLGGDSIRSVMVASRAQARGVDVTVADLHQSPTVRDCAARIDGRQHGGPEAPRTEPFALVDEADRALLAAEVEDAFPLNLLQEGMIFHRDFAAKSAVYHAIASVRLRAPFDLDVMRTVIRQLVERHPMLRTSFDMTSYSRPLQIVHTDFQTPLYFEDVRGLTEVEQEDKVLAWIEREKLRGFELHDYPLIRFMVHRRTDDTFQFTYGFHHEIVDGWSEALMITEIFGHYFSLMFDEPMTIRTPGTGMRDAVALELQALRQQENYGFWDRYLADADLMRLPRFGPGPRADKGAREIVRIAAPVSTDLSDWLKRVAATIAVPLKTVLLAAHMAVMSTYGGNVDTLTYTVTNGRPETSDGTTAIGLFVNSLAVRVRMDGRTWRELIESTLDAERATMPYRRLPMAELKRHQGNEPLAETLFFFTDYHVFHTLDQWISRGVEHVADELYGESTFPFCGIFRLNRETGQLEVRVEYDSLQFSAESMAGVRDCYVRVLEAIATDVDARYANADRLPRADLLALDAFTRGREIAARDECLHDLVVRQAQATPDAVAVQFGADVLTYAALDRQANRFANALAALGVATEDLVGVFAERSVAQIVALLGVLKAGAAYLPLDPAAPDDRNMAIIERSGAKVVAVQNDLASRLPEGTDWLDITAGAGRPVTAPGTTVGPANAAYVIYTSGSTGQPKGVVVEHRNVVASLAARHAAYEAPPERFLLLSSFAFDSSVAGIFWTLSTGGTLILPAEGVQLDPVALVDTVVRQRPTHTLSIPAVLGAVFDQAGTDDLESLSVLIAAGEACPTSLRRDRVAKLPAGRLFNEYGPTEATVWSTVFSDPSIEPGDEGDDRPQLPIGRPVANSTVRAVDHHGRMVPLGVAGELCIGGHQVARGYIGRPADTAAVFVPDPAADAAGARRYATGDLGRYLPDGDVEFLGRNDHQVKINGFRVELGEIEALLETHPSILRSIVIAAGDEGQDRRLIAYLLPAAGKPVEQEEIRGFVRDRLPRYMVPARCVVLDSVPLTATGKVDRASLPVPAAEAEHTHVPPRTETEELLAAIWADVLGLRRIGVDQRFFDIGGESLRAMKVTAAVNKAFNTAISVRRLFDAPTIAEFAREVDVERSMPR
jgi:amino acid adenylation domain-containing protein